MQECADGIMNGLKGRDVVMESPEAERAVLRARDSATGAGRTRLQPPVVLFQQDRVFQDKEAPHPVDGGCGSLGEASGGENWGVDSVHTLGRRLGRTGAGLARIPYVSAGVQCLQGVEPGSSPTSGTVFSLLRGLFGAFFVWTVSTLSPLI
jgi:hypothetical protein